MWQLLEGQVQGARHGVGARVFGKGGTAAEIKELEEHTGHTVLAE